MVLPKVIWVGIGGSIGAIMRYLVSGAVYSWFQKPVFPAGTLAVNIIGCLIIGLLGGLAETRHVFSPEMRTLVFIGFLGSFTTFSSFGYEVFQLMRDGQMALALSNALLHLIVGLIAVWLGIVVARVI
ncbi:fluoride efflux transporter CrcB [candidate division KSB1 bacterium]|nr:fluoride efflux transporter CrcB [candidate division KSB1 bacterium]